MPAAWARRLTSSDESQALTGISPDGHELFYTRLVSNAEWQVVRADASRDGETTVLTTGPFHHGSAELSPDGRLIAYRSDESGSYDVYVQSYPELDAKIVVSVGGGLAPVWSARGDTLYYWQGSRVMAVDIPPSPGLHASAPRELFTANRYRPGGSIARQYHVGPDGRFVMSRAPTLALQSSAGDPFVVVLHWDAELAARDRTN